MSRSVFSCRSCREPLGEVKPSGILHPLPGVQPTFVDHQAGTTFRCPRCGATIVYRRGRVALGGERR